MSNYVKATDFSSKDALASGNPLKIIKGVELNDEFNAIQAAVATKAESTSASLLGNPTATTQPYGNNSTRLATTAFVQTALQVLYPIGTIYTTVDSTNPATLFGFGTWIAFGEGRVLVGQSATDTLFDAVEETGGSKDAVVVSHTHTAVVTDPGHIHQLGVWLATDVVNGNPPGSGRTGQTNTTPTLSAQTGITVENNTAGVSGTNANLPPYIVVYMWKRTM